MQVLQLELWSAEPHPTPPIYQQLTPLQRELLVHRLTTLILKIVQTDSSNSPTAPEEHES